MILSATLFGLAGIGIALALLYYNHAILKNLRGAGEVSLAMVFPHWRGLVGLKVLVVTFLVFSLGTGIAGFGVIAPSPARDWIARGCSAIGLLGILYFLRNVAIVTAEA